MSVPNQSSQKLIQCLIQLETPKRSEAKMDLMVRCGELMPNGNPDFLAVVKYPMIKGLILSEGKKKMLAVVTLLVKDFCSSMNVVRNMNEDQMIEAAGMLIDECGNFRLEDYVMMFQMAKRGQLFDIHDRIDLQVITRMLDKYWQIRHEAGESQFVEEINHFDTLGNPTRLNETVALQDAKLMEMSSGFSSAVNHLKDFFEPKIGNKEEREKLRQIEQTDKEAIRKQLNEKGYATD